MGQEHIVDSVIVNEFGVRHVAATPKGPNMFARQTIRQQLQEVHRERCRAILSASGRRPGKEFKDLRELLRREVELVDRLWMLDALEEGER